MPGLLLPGGKAQGRPRGTVRGYIPNYHCKQCYAQSDILTPLQATDDFLVACHACGFVDERSTYAHTAVTVRDSPRTRILFPPEVNPVYSDQDVPAESFSSAWATFHTSQEKEFKVSHFCLVSCVHAYTRTK